MKVSTDHRTETLSRTSSSGSSLHSLSTDTSDNSENNEIRGLRCHEEYVPPTRIRRVSTILRQIATDNEALDQERVNADLEAVLRREFTVDDAMKVMTNSETPVKDEDGVSVYSRAKSMDQDTVTRVFTSVTGKLELPPDGGYGWVCCFCAGIILFSTWGSNSAFGVYLSYYLDNDIFPGASAMDFAWVAGILVCMGQILSPVALILERFIGFKMTMSLAIVLHTSGYILASFATKLWHLYVCQGVLVGSAYTLICVPALTVVPEWFLKRRALASGLVCTGTGLGGLFYSLTVNAMIKATGNQRWSLRFVGISTAFCMIIGVIFIRKRTHPVDPKFKLKTLNKARKAMFNPQVFKTKKLWYVSLWFAISLVGYTITLFSYASAARALGYSQKQASDLTAVINATQTVGRPLIGVVADKWVGRINYTIILNMTTMVLILAFWMQCHSFAALMVCGILLGLFLGAGNVMNPVLTADAFEPSEFGCAWATLNLMVGIFAVFSEPIALALRDYSLSNPYHSSQIFAAMMFLAGVLILSPLREYKTAKVIKSRRQETWEELTQLNDKTDREREELSQRLKNYDNMLQRTPRGFLKRLVYPIKV